MTLLKTFKEKRISFIILALSLVAGLMELITYFMSQSIMSAKSSPLVVVLALIALLANAFILVFNDFNEVVNISVAALNFLVLGLIISSQFGNLGYYFAGITDIGFGIMPTFVVGFVAGIVATLASSIAVFINK